MATWLLVLGIFAAAIGAVTAVRGRHIGPFVVPYFLFAWLAGELIPHLFVLELVAAAALVAAGALDEGRGWIGLGLLVVGGIGMGVAQFRAQRAEPVLRRALREGLSRPDDSPGELGRVRSYVPYRELVNPFRMRRPGVEVICDIPYGDAGHRHCLDLYRPSGHARLLPVVLQIHGGGWTIGDKREQAKPLMYLLAANGWACVAANYRLSPAASFPDHIVDVKRAIAWIRRRGREYGLDPSFIAITGGSAGGHLAALAALTANQPMFQPGFEEIDTSLSACVPFYGIYDFLDRDGAFARQPMKGFLQRYVMKCSHEDDPAAWESASPVSHVGNCAPPFFVVHGTHDSLALVENARAFVAALRAISSEPVLYAELPGAQHAFETFHSLRTGHTVNAVHRFLENVHAQARARRHRTADTVM